MNASNNTNDRLVMPAEHAAKCPALDGYPCCCSTGAAALDDDLEATPWNWLRGVINGLDSTPSGYRQLIARHDVLAWIDEGERRALASRPEAPAAPSAKAKLTAEDWQRIESLRVIVDGGPDCQVVIYAPTLWRLIETADAIASEPQPIAGGISSKEEANG